MIVNHTNLLILKLTLFIFLFFQKDSIKAKDFTFEKFLTFYNNLVTRNDLDVIFTEL